LGCTILKIFLACEKFTSIFCKDFFQAVILVLVIIIKYNHTVYVQRISCNRISLQTVEL
jgi:hypothetical protein